MLLEEHIPVPVDSVDIESKNNIIIYAAADSKSGIVHNSVVCDGNRNTTPIITPINNAKYETNVKKENDDDYDDEFKDSEDDTI